jgi:regulator of sigma E protease
MLLTIIVFLLLLSVLVLIHEFGHYITARKFGMRVEEFGWGFPPRLFGKKIGETIYSINALPFGGFVKIYGEDDAGGGKIQIKDQRSKIKDDIKRAFFSRPAWQRAVVVFAGVVMNVLLAFVIFYLYFAISGFKTSIPMLADHHFVAANQHNYNNNDTDTVVSYVAPNSPAADLNMSLPAEIVSINNKKFDSRKALIDTVNANKGKGITITWHELMTDQTRTAKVTPRAHPPKNEGSLGVAFIPLIYVTYDTATQKALSGISYTYDFFVYNIQVISNLVAVSFQTKSAAPVGDAVSGPIGIGIAVNEILKFPTWTERILNLLTLAGAMSISLAFFNVLPIPGLDGGRLFFILVEMVMRRKVNQRFETMAHTIGFALLMGLIVLIVFSDIWKFVIPR